MGELTFDTGLKTYTLNGVCEVRFNPTDSAFVQRLYEAFDDLDKKQEAYREEVSKITDPRKVLEFAAARDAEMREVIDGLLGDSVCAALFGGMNVYALANGLPVWCNLMLAILDEASAAMSKEQRATNPRIKKYMDKYKR